MKTVDVEKISLLNDYINTRDSWRETESTVLQFCVNATKDNILLLLKRKEDYIDKEIDEGVYSLTTVLKYLEELLKEAEAIRKEGGGA